MKDIDKTNLSWDEWDELNDLRPAESDFDRVVEQALCAADFWAASWHSAPARR